MNILDIRELVRAISIMVATGATFPLYVVKNPTLSIIYQYICGSYGESS